MLPTLPHSPPSHCPPSSEHILHPYPSRRHAATRCTTRLASHRIHPDVALQSQNSLTRRRRSHPAWPWSTTSHYLTTRPRHSKLQREPGSTCAAHSASRPPIDTSVAPHRNAWSVSKADRVPLPSTSLRHVGAATTAFCSSRQRESRPSVALCLAFPPFLGRIQRPSIGLRHDEHLQ